jgi:hypothetical protein
VACGGAVGLAFAGYAKITDGHAAMERLAEAIADGLSKTVLQTAGTVTRTHMTVGCGWIPTTPQGAMA